MKSCPFFFSILFCNIYLFSWSRLVVIVSLVFFCCPLQSCITSFEGLLANLKKTHLYFISNRFLSSLQNQNSEQNQEIKKLIIHRRLAVTDTQQGLDGKQVKTGQYSKVLTLKQGLHIDKQGKRGQCPRVLTFNVGPGRASNKVFWEN